MKNFGYLLIVNNDKDGLYHSMAHILATSIKKTQPAGYDQICLITDNEKYNTGRTLIYDKIQYVDDTKGWDQRNNMLNLSPFEYTVCLDVDMIMTRDISHWIDYFVNKSSGLVITTNVLKFNGNPITSLKCRPGYKENNLPILYSGFTYFDKSSYVTQNFFKIVSHITANKDIFKNLYMDKKYPKDIGTDEVFSIAVKILGIENEVSSITSFPKFVHLKSELQDIDIQSIETDLGYYFDSKGNITVGTFPQNDIVHYSEKNLPIQELIRIYDSLFLQGIKNV